MASSGLAAMAETVRLNVSGQVASIRWWHATAGFAAKLKCLSKRNLSSSSLGAREEGRICRRSSGAHFEVFNVERSTLLKHDGLLATALRDGSPQDKPAGRHVF